MTLMTEQYTRAVALDSAVKAIQKMAHPTSEWPSSPWSKDDILDLADQFADYIQMGRQDGAQSAG